jgi:hypothetical protein
MPSNPAASTPHGSAAPALTWWERVKFALVRPPEEDARETKTDDRSAEEIEATIRTADDKERAIGLIAAPLAAVIGIVISSASIDYAKTHHQSLTVYDELTYVILGLSVLMLATAWWRKRLFLGITMALYGLAVFNLHYWGFGVPFLMAGSWYLVRAYRLQQALKRAQGAGTAPVRRTTTGGSGAARPRASKRYTPPT